MVYLDLYLQISHPFKAHLIISNDGIGGLVLLLFITSCLDDLIKIKLVPFNGNSTHLKSLVKRETFESHKRSWFTFSTLENISNGTIASSWH